MCTQIECAIRELLNFGGVTIVGPDYSDKNKLRVYADGARIGKIYVGTKSNGKHELISDGYFKHYDASKEHKKGNILETVVKNSRDNLKTMTKSDYINKAKIAIRQKFGDVEGVPSERSVETSIVKEFMNNANVNDWAVIDMEVAFPIERFGGNSFSEKTTQQPRFDIVVVNNSGIGFLELKVNNENVGNLNSHYEHMEFLLQKPEWFLEEIKRRLKVIKPYNLINESLIDVALKTENLWCGFLFVGGDLDKAQNLVNSLSEKEKIDDFKFLYYEDMEDFSCLDINKAVSYKDFVPQD